MELEVPMDFWCSSEKLSNRLGVFHGLVVLKDRLFWLGFLISSGTLVHQVCVGIQGGAILVMMKVAIVSEKCLSN